MPNAKMSRVKPSDSGLRRPGSNRSGARYGRVPMNAPVAVTPCGLPTAAAIPPFEVEHLERLDPNTPLGMKGMAEGGPAQALERAVQQDGLRAQLRLESFVTGVLYVALDLRPDTPIVLRGLDPKQRPAIALAFYDGLSHAELAQHLREPLGTVKTWVRRGLAKLRSCLELQG